MSTKDHERGTRPRHPAKDRVRQFNKHVLNPVMCLLAGRKHWYASALEHVGRRSGRSYTTPVVAGRVPGGFVVPLPYGTDVDWLRNVLAAGTANLRSRGITSVVTEPRIIDAAEAFTQVSPAYAQAWCRFGIARYLRVTVSAEKGK
ncbi:nitroreductase family deazaflavin-dependent oxidoreductase [Amycolatopsis tolypomycina]|uniref:Deazaflavin-dependent oxidoreductase, nitroreductase family n=1 Tax=Amycolatopsis tolypomycina TaxID=208445 RepID=A0A1H4U3Q4_9PSEU|nr:nitroreductase family deazaflavin-dependent oxidoreductase [Amycolatopsis tolypomycina]SEC63230.1 deazaflavin-dependent oxidoreductase, nitroreductase family [Amycolatopsis tolypomycina]